MKRRFATKNYVRILAFMLVCVMMFASCGNQEKDPKDNQQGSTQEGSSSQAQNTTGDKDYVLKVGDEVLGKEVFEFFATIEAKRALDSGMLKSLDDEMEGKKVSELIKMGVVDQFKGQLAIVSHMKSQGFKPNQEDIDDRLKRFKEDSPKEMLRFYKDLGITEEKLYEVAKEQIVWATYQEEFIKRQEMLFRDSAEFKEKIKTQIVQVKARHILVEDEETAKKLIETYNKKEKTFSELASEFSKDPGSAPNGGDLGYFGRGMMVPAFEAATFSLEIGAVSEPVQTQYGYHIILCEDKRTIEKMEKDGVDKLDIERETDRMVQSFIAEPLGREFDRIQKNLEVDVNTEYIEQYVISVKATEPK